MIMIFEENWHWAISGITFGVIMLALNFLGGFFGLSSSYQSICTLVGAGRILSFFDVDWKKDKWQFVFIAGIIAGGAIAHMCQLEISSDAIPDLPQLLFEASDPLMLSILFGGAFLAGFGARYAGGCTSGHFISGISNLQLPSLLTLIFFMIGGFITSYFIIPLLTTLL